MLAELAVSDAGRVRRPGRGGAGSAAGRHEAPKCRCLIPARAPSTADQPRSAARGVRCSLGELTRMITRAAAGSWPGRRGSFLAEGPQAVARGLAPRRPCDRAVRHRRGPGPARRAGRTGRRQGVAVHLVSGEVMAELAQTVTPQGLLAVCRLRRRAAGPGADRPAARAPAGGRRARQRARPRQRRAPCCGPPTRRAPRRCCSPTPRSTPTTARRVRASAGSLFHVPLVAGVPAGAGRRRAAGRGPARARRRRRAAGAPWTSCPGPNWPRPTALAVRQRGLGPARGRCWPWPTSRSRCRSTAGPRASTWPRPPRSASTPAPALSGGRTASTERRNAYVWSPSPWLTQTYSARCVGCYGNASTLESHHISVSTKR